MADYVVKERVSAVLIEPPASTLRGYPYGLVSIAAYLKDQIKLTASVLDMTRRNIRASNGRYSENYVELTDYIRTHYDFEGYTRPIFGIRTVTPSYYRTLQICKAIKEGLKDIAPLIVLGGPHFWARTPAEVTLNKHRDLVDMIAYDEGELTFCGIVNMLREHDDISEKYINSTPVPGLCYYSKSRDKVQFTSCSKKLKLDEIPYGQEFFNIVPPEEYGNEMVYQNEPSAVVMISRGCSGCCSYCSSSVKDCRKVRYRSTANIMDELKELVENRHIHRIEFVDDDFLNSKKSISDLCQSIINIHLNFRWSCIIKPDEKLFKLGDLIELMFHAGCRFVYLGLESGHPDVLEAANRPSADLVKRSIDLFKRYNMKTLVSIQLGLHNESEETIRHTINFLETEINPDYILFNYSTAYPGTKFYREQSKLPDDAYEYFANTRLQNKSADEIRSRIAHGLDGIMPYYLKSGNNEPSKVISNAKKRYRSWKPTDFSEIHDIERMIGDFELFKNKFEGKLVSPYQHDFRSTLVQEMSNLRYLIQSDISDSSRCARLYKILPQRLAFFFFKTLGLNVMPVLYLCKHDKHTGQTTIEYDYQYILKDEDDRKLFVNWLNSTFGNVGPHQFLTFNFKNDEPTDDPGVLDKYRFGFTYLCQHGDHDHFIVMAVTDRESEDLSPYVEQKMEQLTSQYYHEVSDLLDWAIRTTHVTERLFPENINLQKQNRIGEKQDIPFKNYLNAVIRLVEDDETFDFRSGNQIHIRANKLNKYLTEVIGRANLLGPISIISSVEGAAASYIMQWRKHDKKIKNDKILKTITDKFGNFIFYAFPGRPQDSYKFLSENEEFLLVQTPQGLKDSLSQFVMEQGTFELVKRWRDDYRFKAQEKGAFGTRELKELEEKTFYNYPDQILMPIEKNGKSICLVFVPLANSEYAPILQIKSIILKNAQSIYKDMLSDKLILYKKRISRVKNPRKNTLDYMPMLFEKVIKLTEDTLTFISFMIKHDLNLTFVSPKNGRDCYEIASIDIKKPWEGNIKAKIRVYGPNRLESDWALKNTIRDILSVLREKIESLTRVSVDTSKISVKNNAPLTALVQMIDKLRAEDEFSSCVDEAKSAAYELLKYLIENERKPGEKVYDLESKIGFGTIPRKLKMVGQSKIRDTIRPVLVYRLTVLALYAMGFSRLKVQRILGYGDTNDQKLTDSMKNFCSRIGLKPGSLENKGWSDKKHVFDYEKKFAKEYAEKVKI